MMNGIAVILLATIIFKDLKILRELEVKTKKSTINIIVLIIGIGVIIYIVYIYARTNKHFLLGALGIISIFVGYFKTGITSKGFASLYRSAYFVTWDKVQEVKITIGKDIKVSYSGDGFSNRLYFNKRDYDSIVKLLFEKLPGKLDWQPNSL